MGQRQTNMSSSCLTHVHLSTANFATKPGFARWEKGPERGTAWKKIEKKTKRKNVNGKLLIGKLVKNQEE